MTASLLKTRFVAEVSSNHQRDLERCLLFVDEAAACGCAAVKFQQFRIRELFAPEALRHAPQLFFPAMLGVGALCILWGCELLNVRVSDSPDNFRENTVYRFYMPVWLCLGVLTAVVMSKARLLFRHRLRYVPVMQLGIWTFALGGAALVFLSLLHPVVGSRQRGKKLWHQTRLDAAFHLWLKDEETQAQYVTIKWMKLMRMIRMLSLKFLMI